MSGEIDLRTGFLFSDTNEEAVTKSKLNRLVTEIVLRVMAGSITARELADGSISSDKLDSNLTAQLGVADGSVTTGKIVDDAVTNAKLAEMPALSVKGNPANVDGNPQDIVASGIGVLKSSGTALSWAPINYSGITHIYYDYVNALSLTSTWNNNNAPISTTHATIVTVTFKNLSALAAAGITYFICGDNVSWDIVGQSQIGITVDNRDARSFNVHVPKGWFLLLQKNTLFATPDIMQISYQTIS